MIKIKYKIAIPFMLIIIIIPLVTMLVFNIIMQSYILKTSKEDLKNAMETTDYLVKQQSVSGLLVRQNQENLVAFMPKLKAALKTSKIATKTEVIILRQQNIIYPKTFSEDTFLNDEIINKVALIDFDKDGAPQQIEVSNKKYLVAKHSSKQVSYKLVYVLSLDNAYSFIKLINTVLVSILALATILGLFISLLISNSISKPIKKISEIANKIGHGEFVSLEPINTSREISELCNNMNSMSQSLYQFENTQRTFLQNASHELRTPLMSVQGYAEGIINGVFSDNVQAANIIYQESKRLTALVEQLLVLSRIENNTYSLNMFRGNLNNIMKDFVQRIKGLALKSAKELVYNEDNSHIPVCIDDELLYQAVSNIVSNSLRHAESKVMISIYKDNSRAFIKISDDGSGIAGEDLPHIFDRFYKGKGGNFGLGLSIAKSSVIAMEGSVEAYNGDTGAVFLIMLPLNII